jgi:uncharacterized protein with GYD domain
MCKEERIDKAKTALRKVGAELKASCLTMGRYDAFAVVEGANAEALARLRWWNASVGNGRVSVLVGKRNGAFFRLVKCTTSRPPSQAATGGTRHGER